MHAVVYREYGLSEVIGIETVEKPVPKENEVLIKVHASSVNAMEWRIYSADPFLVRLEEGLFKPKNPILGGDVAGEIVEVGAKVSKFEVGDCVFGDISRGAYAEYVATDPKYLVRKPAHLTFEEAAVVPIAGLTAMLALEKAQLDKHPGHVLVNGASGGVGSFTILLAKMFGAEVTAVCSGKNVDWVKRLGADHVINYQEKNFTELPETYDTIIDNVANHKPKELVRPLKIGGVAVVAGFHDVKRLISTLFSGHKKIKAGRKNLFVLSATANSENLSRLAGYVEKGSIRPAVEAIYELSELPKAIESIASRRARGKLAIRVVT
jgi:NADPH:quinone reductase-like Zn-dependent oxidoreductase